MGEHARRITGISPTTSKGIRLYSSKHSSIRCARINLTKTVAHPKAHKRSYCRAGGGGLAGDAAPGGKAQRGLHLSLSLSLSLLCAFSVASFPAAQAVSDIAIRVREEPCLPRNLTRSFLLSDSSAGATTLRAERSAFRSARAVASAVHARVSLRKSVRDPYLRFIQNRPLVLFKKI